MLNQLLETIIQILLGWLNKFESHVQHVEDKLDSLDQTASDIKTNTDPISDIKDNTGAVITPIQNIKSNTDSIATSSLTSANNTTAILNNIGTLSTNTGRAAAFAQDCANNTLNILDKVTTIASDTTQIRANTAAIEDIKDLMQYYFINTIVTEDSEGVICNFDTDLEDYLQALKVTIPADLTGYTGITLIKCGKNLINDSLRYIADATRVFVGATSSNYLVYLKEGKYTISADFNNNTYALLYREANDSSNRTVWPAGTTDLHATITVTSGWYRFWVYASGGVDNNNIKQLQIEVGETVSEYEAYKEMSYPVSFGSTITDGAEADLLSGLVKVNTTPESFLQIQPIAVRTYKGVNNFFLDVGTSAITYRETLKKYLEKHNQ